MAGLIGVRECSSHDVTEFCNIAHVNAPHSWIKRESPAHGSVILFLRSKNDDNILIVEQRDDERMIRKTGFFNYTFNLDIDGIMRKVKLASTDHLIDHH